MLRAALRRFAADPHDALLRTHRLKGDLGAYWAFTVDDDLRVLFRWEGEEAFLVNFGSHDEVIDGPGALDADNWHQRAKGAGSAENQASTGHDAAR
jgi:hypothetical protein